jgi:PleD family two-component response regulator
MAASTAHSLALAAIDRRTTLDALSQVQILCQVGVTARVMRILVIEDERQLAGHITRALSRHGHCLTITYDGVEGLQAALSDPPDLVLLDLNLPGLDGLSVLSFSRRVVRWNIA